MSLAHRAAPLLLGTLLCVGALQAAATEVRVLLRESSGPQRVDGVRVAVAGKGLAVDGRPVGSRWRAPGRSPHRVGDLQVRGDVVVERAGRGLRVVNRVPLETYLAGTLGSEIYSSWSPAALRAQAVVSRTYALYQRAIAGKRGFDLEADTSHQVYGGLGVENDPVRRAVADTRSEVLTWRGEPILAAFHSASGGRTASAEEVWGRPLPYLRSVPVEGEEMSPDTYWRAHVPKSRLGPALAPLGLDLGAIRGARVVERSPSGRVLGVELLGSQDASLLRGRDLRDALGAGILRSTMFEIRDRGDELVFVGSGHGHGVGMSQWGAQAMAQRGASHEEILAAFFPGTELVRWSER